MEPQLLESRRGWLRTRTVFLIAGGDACVHGRLFSLVPPGDGTSLKQTQRVLWYLSAYSLDLLPSFFRLFSVLLPSFYRLFTVFLPSFYRLFTVLLPSFYRFCFEIDLQRSKDHVRGRGNYWRQKWEKICVFRKNTLSLQSN